MSNPIMRELETVFGAAKDFVSSLEALLRRIDKAVCIITEEDKDDDGDTTADDK